jgi:CBS domain-containing protein
MGKGRSHAKGSQRTKERAEEGGTRMSLLRQGKAQALTIYVGESDQWQGTSLYVALVQYLREQGCAGATVTRAIAGYGAGMRLHTTHGWHWSSQAPVIIQVIDQPDRLQRLLPHIQEMLGGGLMTLHEVDVLKYTHARSHGIPSHLPVRQIMETSVVTVQPTTPIATVIDILLAAPFRVLPVVDADQRLLGIISTGDLITAKILPMRRGLVRMALALDEQSAEVTRQPLDQARVQAITAQDVMNRQVRTIEPERPAREAACLMVETGLRRLPVVSAEGILQGMLTRADLLQLVVTSPLMTPAPTGTSPLEQRKTPTDVPLQQRPIGDYATPNVATVSPDSPLSDVIDALMLSPFKRVVVIDAERHVVGIISDVDLLAKIQEENRPLLLRWLISWARKTAKLVPTGALRSSGGTAHVAADVMNREVVTVTETTSVQETVTLMMRTHRKALPVVTPEKQLLGVVGRSGLLRLLLEE